MPWNFHTPIQIKISPNGNLTVFNTNTFTILTSKYTSTHYLYKERKQTTLNSQLEKDWNIRIQSENQTQHLHLRK